MLHDVVTYDVRGLHRTRVASRRLRELLPVLQLDSKVAGDLGHRLRRITRRLGKVRELDVCLMIIESLQTTGRYDRESLALVAAALVQERAAAGERLLTKLPLRELRRIGSKLDKLAHEFEDVDATSKGRRKGQALLWAVEARIHRRGAALKGAIEDAGAVYLPNRLHKVRVALKKFRYTVELAREITKDSRMVAPLQLLKRGQDLLGRWHDQQVLLDRIRQLQASLTPPDIVVWRGLASLVTMIEKDSRRIHARYVRQCGPLVAVCDRFAARPPAAARHAG
jgi:CHAD domain-containing protein